MREVNLPESSLIGFECQSKTVAASMIPERNVSGRRSYRVTACCQSLETAGHDLDAVVALIAPLVVFDGLLAKITAGDARLYTLVFQRVCEPIGTITPICQKPGRLRQAAQQSSRVGAFTHVTRRHEDLDRPPPRIRHGVQSGVPFTGEAVDWTVSSSLKPFASPDLASARPFFTPWLDAARCALAIGRIDHDGPVFGPMAARPTTIRAKTPFLL